MAEAASRGLASYSINGWHKYCRGIHGLVTEERILDYVQDLLGEDGAITSPSGIRLRLILSRARLS
jgi:hypothetical protein